LLELLYANSFGGALVVSGDIISASQNVEGHDAVVIDWNPEERTITTLVDKRTGYVTYEASDLGLQWVEKPDEERRLSNRRLRANLIRDFRCRYLTAVVENPRNIMNLASVIRNANALGVERVYVVDGNKLIPDDWEEMRKAKKLNDFSVSGSKWTFIKRFDTTDECFDHLEKYGYKSVVTSSHIKGKRSVYLNEGDYTELHKLAVWFGSETRGISERAVERAEMCVSVPMFGMVESLNLGTCSGIVLYEVTKQRREYQSKYRHRGKRGLRDEPLPTVLPPSTR